MHVETNHLVADIKQVPGSLQAQYDPVPSRLQPEARRELDGRQETYLSPTRTTALATWAAKKREANRARARRAKEARRQSRK